VNSKKPLSDLIGKIVWYFPEHGISYVAKAGILLEHDQETRTCLILDGHVMHVVPDIDITEMEEWSEDMEGKDSPKKDT
jgi:hypothetical protein